MKSLLFRAVYANGFHTHLSLALNSVSNQKLLLRNVHGLKKLAAKGAAPSNISVGPCMSLAPEKQTFSLIF